MAFLALIVEDDITAADISSRQLEAIGFQTEVVGTAQEGLDSLANSVPSLVVIDERLPDDSGTNLIRIIRENAPNTTIVMCTVVDDETMIQKAFSVGCNYYVVKPNGLRKLCASCTTPEQLLDSGIQKLFLSR